jgi:kynurenine formamidase
VVSRRAALTGIGAAAAAAVTAGTAPAAGAATARDGGGAGHPHHHHHGRAADLSHVLSEDFPAFIPGEEASRRTTVTVEEDGFYIQEWRLIEHIGTHVDAPGHFIAGGRLGPDLTVEELVLPAVVVDIAARAARDPDTTVSVDDLRRFERRHGRIPAGAAVLMHSGWAARVGDPAAYRGTDADGVLHFPGFSVEACEWLLRRRRVRCLGVDTLSIDPGESSTFDTHLTLLGADRYGLENLANLQDLPPSGATVVVGLLPLRKGSGGPARVLAHW